MEWFTVDKQGLAKLLERKGKAFVLFELLQNCWDTEAREIHVKLEPLSHKPYCELTVTDDDPSGFAKLEHAFTLFAESEKKNDPSKRGRFNLGEKLVLSLCEEASISSTTGTVEFTKTGRRTTKVKTEQGSVFTGTVRMTRAEYTEVLEAAKTLIGPHDKRTFINGEELPDRPRVVGFCIPLPTEIGDSEGYLRRTVRETLVQLHEVSPGEHATLYEMGIPVVELAGGEPWHINVHQKIPLNSDRDNVTPAYLRELRTAVLNRMHESVKGADEASKTWVREAMSDSKAEPDAVKSMVEEAFGKKAVVFDPSDPEANKLAVSEGYTVIPGGALPKGAWENVRKNEVVKPAGQVTPSPKPFSDEGDPLKVIGPDKWTPGMRRVVEFTKNMGTHVLSAEVSITLANDTGWPFSAAYGRKGKGRGHLTFNVGRLGKAWFDRPISDEEIVRLVIHEFGHHFSGDHLAKEYHDALCRLGAGTARFALKHPEMFQDSFYDDAALLKKVQES